MHRLDERIGQYDRHLAQIARQDSRAARLKRLNGIGDTTATAILAIVGNGAEFNDARQVCRLAGFGARTVQLRGVKPAWATSPRRAIRIFARYS